MILKETLREIVISQRNDLLSSDNGIERGELRNINLNIPYATILSGIRRSGKSTLLHQVIDKMPVFYYLNFEDIRLIDFEASDFEKLDNVFHEEYGNSEDYFFDEIQNVDRWEIFVRSRLDKKKHFLITGSNASMLSREPGSRLTGRHLDIELFPFSYYEFLLLEGKKASPQTFYEYLYSGGFPEYLKFKRDLILRELLMDILQRDIILRYKIRESKILIDMAIYLLTNTGMEFSYHKIKTIFNLGSINTVISFISYLEDAYLFFTVPRFYYSIKRQLINAKKIYSIDNGLAAANSVLFSNDRGIVLENAVFLFLRRKYREIYYFKEKHECDFVIKDKNSIIMALQVTYLLNDDNKEREIDGLLEAMSELSLNEGYIITYNEEDELNIENKKISIVPAWKWMS